MNKEEDMANESGGGRESQEYQDASHRALNSMMNEIEHCRKYITYDYANEHLAVYWNLVVADAFREVIKGLNNIQDVLKEYKGKV